MRTLCAIIYGAMYNNIVISTGADIFHMETTDQLRRQLIEQLMAQRTENVAYAAIDLWESLAIQIVSLVGEEGFRSLYARSAFCAQSKFPWLAAHSLSPQTDQRFAELKKTIEGQTAEQARSANSLLLITFTDILAALIGEQLTAGILRSAWGNGAPYSSTKEFKNE